MIIDKISRKQNTIPLEHCNSYWERNTPQYSYVLNRIPHHVGGSLCIGIVGPINKWSSHSWVTWRPLGHTISEYCSSTAYIFLRTSKVTQRYAKISHHGFTSNHHWLVASRVSVLVKAPSSKNQSTWPRTIGDRKQERAATLWSTEMISHGLLSEITRNVGPSLVSSCKNKTHSQGCDIYAPLLSVGDHKRDIWNHMLWNNPAGLSWRKGATSWLPHVWFSWFIIYLK